MSTTITFKISPTLNRDLGTLAVPMLGRLALKVETEAKRLVPVKTGNLRRSITSAVSVAAGIPTAAVAATAHYGGFVEVGTAFMAPQPYLRPALVKVIRGGVA
jgi:HK97 gp10 family phage protein